ncbi:MAG: hypothetical protein H7287_02830 [Thermoleophilia bacterium]|nr:hypothetical protein [Thermoleophilia bacterium]
MQTTRTFSVLDVLTRSGAERDHFITALDATVDTDVALVSDVLRVTGRVGAARANRTTLVELCALLRALDAWETGTITLAELGRGLDAHAARTDDFERFGSARVDLRTLEELLMRAREHEHALDDTVNPLARAVAERPVRSQVAFLHASLRAWLIEELTGSVDGALPAAPAAAALGAADPDVVEDTERLRSYNALAEELLTGTAYFDFLGLLAAAWRRGWSAVPRHHERLGDDGPELRRFITALRDLGEEEFVEVDLAPRARWQLAGGRIVVADGLRRVALRPLDATGIAAAIAERPAHALFTSPDGSFAYLEGDEHHVVAGPHAFVEAVCGAPPGEAPAAFRDYVEARAGADDDDPPQHLVQVAERYGRLRRRGRGTS